MLPLTVMANLWRQSIELQEQYWRQSLDFWTRGLPSLLAMVPRHSLRTDLPLSGSDTESAQPAGAWPLPGFTFGAAHMPWPRMKSASDLVRRSDARQSAETSPLESPPPAVNPPAPQPPAEAPPVVDPPRPAPPQETPPTPPAPPPGDAPPLEAQTPAQAKGDDAAPAAVLAQPKPRRVARASATAVVALTPAIPAPRAKKIAPPEEATPAPEISWSKPGATPLQLEEPRGSADDLIALKGIGPRIQKVLNDLGIFHFAQIAAWSPEQTAWIERKLDFPGRVGRENWISQARARLSAQD